MAPRSDAVRLAEAWRALAGDAGGSGWRTVHLVQLGEVAILAGRQKPDDREALLLDFRHARKLSRRPEGHATEATIARIG